MLDKQDSLNYASEFLSKIRKNGIEIKIAKLFGSCSRSETHEYSDIDLLLVSDSFIGVGFIDNKLLAKELIEYDKIQVKTYNYKDYLERDPFIDEIEKTAITIH